MVESGNACSQLACVFFLLVMVVSSAEHSAGQRTELALAPESGLDAEPFSPNKVSTELEKLRCMCDAKQKYPNIFSFIARRGTAQREGSLSSQAAVMVSRAGRSGSRMGRTATGNPCMCDPFASQDPGPQNEIDGVVYWVNQCQVTGKDLDFWRLRNTDYRPGGIMLEKTVAYSASCDDCASHNLKCDAAPTSIYTGYCLCMWRVNGADPKLKLVPCGRCPTDCIGKYMNFDVSAYMQPVQQRGICIKKKGYFR